MLKRTLQVLPTLILAFMALLLWLLPILVSRSLSAETITGTRISSVTLLLLAVLTYALRAHISVFVGALLADSWRAGGSLLADVRLWWRDDPRWQRDMLLLLIVFGGLLRWTFIQQPIRTDEAVTYLNFASKPLYLALTDYAAPNNHLFHTLFVHLFTRLFTGAEWVIRQPAFWSGLLLMPATYYTVRRLYNRDAGLLAAAFVAVSSVLIEYSVNARGYTLQTLLFLLAVATAHYLRQHNHHVGWALLAVLSALAFYTIPTALYAIGGLYVWLLLAIWLENPADKRRPLLLAFALTVIAGAALTLLLYAPVLIVSGLGAIVRNSYVVAQPFSDFAAQLPAGIGRTLGQWHNAIPVFWLPVLFVGLVVGLCWHRRVADHPVPLLLPLVLWSLLVVLVQRVIPFERVWLFLLPLYFGAAAAGIVWSVQRVPRLRLGYVLPVLPLLVLIAGGLWIRLSFAPVRSIETGTFRNAEQVTLLLDGVVQAGEGVLYEHPSGEALRYYMWLYSIDDIALEQPGERHSIVVVVNSEYAQDVNSVLRVNGIQDPTQYAERELLAEFFRAEVYRVTR